MTDYKYRVYDGATGNEFGDVANLSLALLLMADLRDNYPQVTIDEIVPEVAAVREPQVGDRVRASSGSAGGSYGPGQVGELLQIDNDDTLWPYRIRVDGDSYGAWFSAVELV